MLRSPRAPHITASPDLWTYGIKDLVLKQQGPLAPERLELRSDLKQLPVSDLRALKLCSSTSPADKGPLGRGQA